MTFSDDDVQKKLPEHFVLAWENTDGKKGSGDSYVTKPGEDLPYQPRMAAGFNNSQIIILAPDGTVLNVYPGYWNGSFFKKIIHANWLLFRQVWTNKDLPEKRKKKIYHSFYRGEARLLKNEKIGVPPEQRKLLLPKESKRDSYRVHEVEKVKGGGKQGADPMRNKKKIIHLKIKLTKEPYFMTSWSEFDVVSFVGLPSGFSKFYGIEPENSESDDNGEEVQQTDYQDKEESEGDEDESFEDEEK